MSVTLIDRWATILSSNYLAGAGTLNVSVAPPGVSGVCYFYLIVQAEGANTEEVMLCTNVSGTALTVVGAKSGTAASNHAAGATVIGGILTADLLNQLVSSAGSNINPGVPSSDAIPDFTTWTWANQGSATLSQANGAGFPAIINLPNASLNWRMLDMPLPSVPFALVARKRGQGPSTATWGHGLYFTDGTKWMGIEILGNFEIRVEKANNATTDNSTAATYSGASGYTTSDLYFAIASDGSTLYFKYSFDGNNWVTLYSESVGTFITPTAVGWGGVTASPGGVVCSQLVYYRLVASVNP